MNRLRTVQTLVGFFAVLVLLGSMTAGVSAWNQTQDPERARIQQGYAIAPVPLNIHHKDGALVGLGSYLVNTGCCNDCHTTDPTTQYKMNGNPYFGQRPTQVNPATYLAGGQDFG